MSMSRFILGMATVASLMFNLGCEEVDAACTGSCQTQTADATNSSPDGSVNAGDHGPSSDTSKNPDTSSGDQSVVEVAVDVNSDPCAEWRWMEQYKWQCPADFGKNEDVKFKISVENGVCMAKSIIMSKKKTAELICNKEEKKFIFLEEQMNNQEVHCQIIEG